MYELSECSKCRLLSRRHIVTSHDNIHRVTRKARYIKYFGKEPSTERLESLFAKDRAHPGLWGSYLYSCMIYSAMTGRSPIGLAAPESIPADVAKTLQETAWAQHQETAAQLKK